MKTLKHTLIDDNEEIKFFSVGRETRRVVAAHEKALHGHIVTTTDNCGPTSGVNDFIHSYVSAFRDCIEILVMNSIQHGFGQGVQGRINIQWIRVNDGIDVYYSDNGSGMNAETLQHVFEPFFTTKRNIDEFLGLGLHIADTLVKKKLNGHIKLWSWPGSGMICRLHLPDLQSGQKRGSPGSEPQD